MTQRETAFMEMTRLDVPGAETERIEVYIDDGTPVDPERLTRHMGVPNDAPAITQPPQEFQIFEKQQLLDMISTAVVAATSAQAKKGATPESVRQVTHAALGVSPQVNDPGQLELGDAEVNTI